MAFPKNLLVPGEELVLDLRPHPVALLVPTVATLGLVIGGIWLMTLLNFTDWIDWVLAALILVGLIAYPIRRLTWWLTSHFVVTSDRLIHREGWLAKRSMEVPLEAINDIRFKQGVFERMIGAGDLIIRSAADSTPQTFEDIRHPEDVMKTIYHEAELNNQRMYLGRGTKGGTVQPATPGQPPAAPSAVGELERLAELHTKGLLTDEEFQAQKAKILGAPPTPPTPPAP
jgi:membrane protein YdbS with pleckstrin-like domain